MFFQKNIFLMSQSSIDKIGKTVRLSVEGFSIKIQSLNYAIQ